MGHISEGKGIQQPGHIFSGLDCTYKKQVGGLDTQSFVYLTLCDVAVNRRESRIRSVINDMHAVRVHTQQRDNILFCRLGTGDNGLGPQRVSLDVFMKQPEALRNAPGRFA